MKTYTIAVENLKCNGCATTVHKAMLAIPGISNVWVAVKENTVQLEIAEGYAHALHIATSKLHQLGYPQAGDNTSLEKVRSYVSCAMGKLKAY